MTRRIRPATARVITLAVIAVGVVVMAFILRPGVASNNGGART
jgi:hypothetical protein